MGLQVTSATDRTIELRALVSSPDSSLNWDLRCAVRECLLGFVQGLKDGAYLPRTRIEAPARMGEEAASTGRKPVGAPRASS